MKRVSSSVSSKRKWKWANISCGFLHMDGREGEEEGGDSGWKGEKEMGVE